MSEHDTSDQGTLHESSCVERRITGTPKRRWLTRLCAGESLTTSTGQWNRRMQFWDREHDVYRELVTNSVTGEVIHDARNR